MPRYRLSKSANADLNDIAIYSRDTWGSDTALNYLDALQELITQLAESPKLGKACNDLAEGLRSFQHQSHVVFYLEKKGGIVIARVLHERMNAPLRLTGGQFT
jgi:toxin ParE1/3/4